MNKQDIAIVVVCVILLFAWGRYTVHTLPPPPAPNSDVATTDAKPVLDDELESEHAGHIEVTASSAPLEPPAMVEGFADLPPAEPVKLTRPDVIDIIIDPERGGVTNVLLHQFNADDRISVMRLGHDSVPMLAVNGDTPWTFSHSRIITATSTNVVIERAVVDSPLIVRQAWTMDPEHPFRFDCVLEIKNGGVAAVEAGTAHLQCGTMQPLETAQGLFSAGGIDQRIDVKIKGDDDPETIMLADIEKADKDERADWQKWGIDWLAVQNKYFTSIVTTDAPFSGCSPATTPIAPDEIIAADKDDGHYISSTVGLERRELAPGESQRWSFSWFVGPKHYDLLEQLGHGQESIMHFDLFMLFHFEWMEWISLLIFMGLKLLESLFNSYGLAILCLTLIIRLAFWPLTHRSTLLSRRMQEMQPQIQALKEKYSDDPQQMSAKTWELYREHKVNPVTGCLPMFFQIPVFFALFNVLRSAIELRQAGFLWATDLSQPDTIFVLLGLPVNPLALLMGVTMILQQKMVPTSADPAQQKVMLFMSGFFVLLLYSMPSGLTLYWTMSNIVSIFQYKVTHTTPNKTEAQPEARRAVVAGKTR